MNISLSSYHRLQLFTPPVKKAEYDTAQQTGQQNVRSKKIDYEDYKGNKGAWLWCHQHCCVGVLLDKNVFCHR